MKKIYKAKILSKLLLMVFTVFMGLKAGAVQLNGTYTIDSAGTASTTVFLNFSSAITYLTSTNPRSDGGPANTGTVGVSGPVVFDVLQGTYTEQVNIPAITGASATNTITFDGGLGNVNTRVLQFTASSTTDAHTLRFTSSASFITVKNITIRSLGASGIGVHFFAPTNNITIKQCSVMVNNNTSTGTKGLAATASNISSTGSGCSGSSGAIFNIFVDSNYIWGGNIGVFLSSNSNTSIPHNFSIRWNTIENSFATAIGASGSNGYLIEGNNIKMATGNANSKGIHHCNGSSSGTQSYKVIGNIFENCGQHGIYFQSNNSNTNTLYPTLIINNYFKPTFSNTTPYAMDMSQPRNMYVLNNTILMNMPGGHGINVGSSAGTLCHYKNNIIQLQGANSTGLCMISTAANVDSCDFNVFMKNSTSSLNIATLKSVTYTRTNFIGGGGLNFNSTMEDPRLISVANPRPTNVCQKGENSNRVLVDLFGTPRTSPPQIGCAEGTGAMAIDASIVSIIAPATYPLVSGTQDVKVIIKNSGGSTITNLNVTVSLGGTNTSTINWFGSLGACNTDTVTFTGSNQLTFATGSNLLRAWIDSPNFMVDSNALNDTISKTFCTPISTGNYTVGVGGTFASLTEVANALNCGGISGSGPTVFEIISGTYNEQFNLGIIAGTSASNPIIFKSLDNNADSVTIEFNATAANNYTISMAGTSFITFKDLTIKALNSTNARVVEFSGSISRDTIMNCKISGPISTSTGNTSALIYASGVTGKFNVFSNNIFANAGYGIYLYGSSAALVIDSSAIENNSFTGCYYMTIATSFLSNTKIKYNNIVGGLYIQSYGIYLTSGYNAMDISHNKISGVGLTGIYLSGVNGTSTLMGQIRNNAISGGTTTTYYGMYFSSCTYLNVISNSVVGNSNATSTNYACYTQFTSTTGTTNIFRNNIFSNNAVGTAISVAALYVYNTLYLNSNYNNLFCAGPNLVNVATPAITHPNIAAWRAASPYEKNSISYRPGFTSNTNVIPNPLDSNAWAINGHGTFVAGNTIDIDGNPRPLNVTEGTPDLGAYEFTPVSLPPAAITNNAQLAPDSSQVFMFAGDTVAVIKWDQFSFPPTSITVRRFSGVRPPSVDTLGNNYMYFYTQVTGTTGFYNFELKNYYKNEWLGRVPYESVLKAATKDTVNVFSVWTPFTFSSSTDTVRNIISLTNNNFMDYWYTGTDENNPLPVKLVNFAAKSQKGNVIVTWKTSEEINNKGFEVERSINGRNFQKVGFVKGAANSSILNSYSLLDDNAFEKTNAKTLYYRLKQVDFDGSSTYSNIAVVNKDASSKLETVLVHPNPFTDQVNISVTAAEATQMNVTIINLSGKEVGTLKIDVQEGTNTINLNDFEKLNAGVYFLKVNMGSESKMFKIAKSL